MYRFGFEKLQQAYEAAVVQISESLDRFEKIHTEKDHLTCDRLTGRIFASSMYAGHFKCKTRTIRGEYPAMHL